jgi:ComF family protein
MTRANTGLEIHQGSQPGRLAQLVDMILPPRCVVTGQAVDIQGMISPEAWKDLGFIAAPFCVCCGIPLEFEVEKDSFCASCVDEPPFFDSARSALTYNDTSRSIILRFKHADQIHIVHSFTPWLKRAGKEMLPKADFLIPVPLHRYRLLRRRYNQAALIAKALAVSERIPCLPDAMLRNRATPSQGHMRYNDRQKNVRNAFTVNTKHALKLVGKTVVLIDDVYTTGATVKECAKALRKAGVANVHVLTLARVVRSQYYG